jgi:hypothetical protein
MVNWLVFITKTVCVYCAVRTGSLHVIRVSVTVHRANQVTWRSMALKPITQDVPRLLPSRTPKAHDPVHNGPRPPSLTPHMHYILSFHLRLLPATNLTARRLTTNSLRTAHLFPTCCMPRPSQRPWNDHTNNFFDISELTQRAWHIKMSYLLILQIVTLLTMQVGPSTHRKPHCPITSVVMVEAESSSETPVTHAHYVTNQDSPCLFICLLTFILMPSVGFYVRLHKLYVQSCCNGLTVINAKQKCNALNIAHLVLPFILKLLLSVTLYRPAACLNTHFTWLSIACGETRSTTHTHPAVLRNTLLGITRVGRILGFACLSIW